MSGIGLLKKLQLSRQKAPLPPLGSAALAWESPIESGDSTRKNEHRSVHCPKSTALVSAEGIPAQKMAPFLKLGVAASDETAHTVGLVTHPDVGLSSKPTRHRKILSVRRRTPITASSMAWATRSLPFF